jgi:FAD/FMN-containing dehydrogenase
MAARQSTLLRIPDAVVWPRDENDVRRVVSIAQEKNWCLIPFGGGTNVSHATRCPSLAMEPRPIISLDTRLLCKIVRIDDENRLAEVEAGITGKQLEEGLARRGYTMGHEPDSLEKGKLRLLYEGIPMAMIIEQAGGVASTGLYRGKIQRVLDLVPEQIHDKCPIIMGGHRDVQRVYDEYAKTGMTVPTL